MVRKFQVGEKVLVKMASVGLQGETINATIIYVPRRGSSYQVEADNGAKQYVPEERLIKVEV